MLAVLAASSPSASRPSPCCPTPTPSPPWSRLQATLLTCDLWWRTERSSGDARRSLLWLFLGLGFTAVVGGHVVFLVDGGKGRTIDAVALSTALVVTLAVPVTMTIGALAPRLRDVRQLISQTVLYLVLLEVSLALFIGAVEAARWSGREPNNQVLGIIAIALAAGFHPAAVQVRRVLDDILFGGTADPIATMTAFGAHLRSETDPQSWAQGLRAAARPPARGDSGSPTSSWPRPVPRSSSPTPRHSSPATRTSAGWSSGCPVTRPCCPARPRA